MHIEAFSPSPTLANFAGSYGLWEAEVKPHAPVLLLELPQLCCSHALSGPIATVADSILHEHGQVNIEALAQAAGMSRRQLERRFRAEVGTSPKLYARLARFHHVFELLADDPAPDWQDVAYLCGYYDQAHLIREFRHFTGETPAAYFVRHSYFAHLLAAVAPC